MLILTTVLVVEPPPWHTQTDQLGQYLCGVDRYQSDKGKWHRTTTCQRYADAFIAASKKYDVNLELLLAIAYVESDMRGERIADSTFSGNLAYDVGLMGLHCEVGQDSKCATGWVKGETVKSLMNPRTNIMYAAKILKALMKGAFDSTCKCEGHPKWAHYNWGSKAFLNGTPVRYPIMVRAVKATLSYKFTGNTEHLNDMFVEEKRVNSIINGLMNVPAPNEVVFAD